MTAFSPTPFSPALAPPTSTTSPGPQVIAQNVQMRAATLPQALPHAATTIAYQATPSGYQPIASSASADPNPASGSFSSFPPGCGSGGTCDWDEYRAQQARIARAITPPVKAPAAAGPSPYAAPGAIADNAGAAATPDAPTKRLLPLAQVQCALASLMGQPSGWPALNVSGTWDSVTQRYLDGYISGHLPSAGYTIVDNGTVQLDEALAQVFATTPCGVPAKMASSKWLWWIGGAAAALLVGGTAWWALRHGR